MSSNFTDITLKKIEKILSDIEKGMAISIACTTHQISRPTFYRWIHASKENSTKLYSLIDARTTEVEDALHKKALDGDTTAMIFWLKNRSRDRWSDKQTIQHEGSIVINVGNKKTKEGLNDMLGETNE